MVPVNPLLPVTDKAIVGAGGLIYGNDRMTSKVSEP